MQNKVAIVTGGTHGIGAAIVERLVNEGAKVVFCGRDVEEGVRKQTAYQAQGHNVIFSYCDVTVSTDVENLVTKTVAEFGQLTTVIANAGGATITSWEEETDDAWDETLQQNLGGVRHICKFAWPYLQKAEGASIVAISSLSAWGGIGLDQLLQMGGVQPNPAYQTSKAAVEGLMVHLAGRGGEHDIRVNTVSPGRILTAEWEAAESGDDSLFWSMYQKIQMLKTHGRPDDVANAVLFLASDEARFITATVLDVNGGAVAKV